LHIYEGVADEGTCPQTIFAKAAYYPIIETFPRQRELQT